MAPTRHALACAIGLAAGGCGSAPAPEPGTPVDEPRTRPRDDRPLDIHAEVGALDPAEVIKVFKTASADVEACFHRGAKALATLGGELEVLLRIDKDGRVRYGLPIHSTVGDVTTERCVVAELAEREWPRPQGGDEGEAHQKMDMPSAGRAPVAWAASDLGPKAAELRARLQRCQRDAGTVGLAVTVYVDPDGKPLAAGAAVGDEAGAKAIDCAVSAARGLRYPSPGSWPAKVTVTAE